jgi:multiple sugar transport system permease protein
VAADRRAGGEVPGSSAARIARVAAPYLFIGPALLGLALFKLYPILVGLAASLFDYEAISGRKAWVGLGNYRELLADGLFWRACWNTFLFNAVVTPLQVILALGLAVLVNRRLPGMAVFRAIFFVPAVISLVVASIVWDLIYNPDNGLANSLLAVLGVPPQPFLVSARQAMGAVIAMVTWKGVGYWMVIFLAGLQAIPGVFREAALLDGASAWQFFWRVTLPLLVRTIVFVVVADTAINFLLFAPMYIMTQGGPSDSTTVLMFEVYRNAFVYFRLGYASAVSTVLLALMLVVVLVQFRVLRPRVEY